MARRTLLNAAIFAGMLGMVVPGFATDLLQIYNTALASSPLLKSQKATSEAGSEALGINFGELLPQLSVTGDADAVAVRSSPANANYTLIGYTAIASQTLFDATEFGDFGNGYHSAQAAKQTYQYQYQTFILTVAQRYFDVLEARDNVTFSEAKAEFLRKTLTQTQQKLEVGLSTRTDEAQALANYDQAIAEVIANQNALQNAREQLRVLTGKKEMNLAALKNGFPYEKPNPDNVKYWVKQAIAHNHSLKAAENTADASLDTVYATMGNQLPKVTAQATYGVNQYSVDVPSLVSSNFNSKNWTASLSLTWSIFSGGSQFASSIQAAHSYAASDAQADNTYRNVEKQTRQDYRNVLAQIAQVQAFQQSVKAGESSVEQYEARYQVGTETIVNVLDQLQRLYQSKQNLAQAQYNYILAVLNLKRDAGQLTVQNLEVLNQWLKVTH